MYDYGELVLNGRDYQTTYYITTYGPDVIISTNKAGMQQQGQVTVYHNGTYFGTPEQMDSYLQDKVFDYLVTNNYLVEDGETIAGETRWTLKEAAK